MQESESADNSGHGKVVKLCDYLYEVTYTDYVKNFEKVRELLEATNPKLGACSAVQYGGIRGRNYDWYYDEAPEFVIHVPAKEGRHASVGVATLPRITAAMIDAGADEEVYDILPYFTLDGVNDAGMTVNINVVNYQEKGEYVMKTATRSDDLSPIMICRMILDKAGSIEEAIEFLSDWDIYSLRMMDECHFMLTGPASRTDGTRKTVVIEFVPDAEKHYQLSVVEKFVDDKMIMTNFHVTGFDGSEESLTAHPMGYERYQILKESYDLGKTVEGMKELMSKVNYSKFYDIDSDRFWYTDLCYGDLVLANRGEAALHGDPKRAGVYEKAVLQLIEDKKNATRTTDVKIWHTVHTSVYDIDRKVLSVQPQETGEYYDFDMTGRI